MKPPRKDTCSTCDEMTARICLEQAEGKETTALEEQLTGHKKKAKEAQNYIKTLQKDTLMTGVIAIDL